MVKIGINIDDQQEQPLNQCRHLVFGYYEDSFPRFLLEISQ